MYVKSFYKDKNMFIVKIPSMQIQNYAHGFRTLRGWGEMRVGVFIGCCSYRAPYNFIGNLKSRRGTGSTNKGLFVVPPWAPLGEYLTRAFRPHVG